MAHHAMPEVTCQACCGEVQDLRTLQAAMQHATILITSEDGWFLHYCCPVTALQVV